MFQFGLIEYSTEGGICNIKFYTYLIECRLFNENCLFSVYNQSNWKPVSNTYLRHRHKHNNTYILLFGIIL